MRSMFKKGDKVIHVKSGKQYTILEAPSSRIKLEYCNESCYTYFDMSSRPTFWIRRKSEVEDGRFKHFINRHKDDVI